MAKLQEDLVSIRQQLKLSADDIHDKTRLSTLIISQIEDGSIFKSKQNKTYIRSFVRTYARALGISDDDMIEALDQMDVSNYQGFLLKRYATGQTPTAAEQKKEAYPKTGATTASSSPKTPAAKPPQPQKADQGSKPDTTQAPSSGADKTSTNTSGTKAQSQPQPQSQSQSKSQSQSQSQSQSASQGTKAAAASASSKSKETASGRTKASTVKAGRPARVNKTGSYRGPDASEVNWSDVSRGASKKSPVPVSAILIVALVLIALGAFGYWYLNSEDGFSGLFSDSIPPTEQQTTVPDRTPELLLSDTLDAPVAPDPGLTSAPAQTLPDTLAVVIYAATGNLEPFRVSADTFENRRPYWVEIGRGMRVQFIDEIVLTGNFNRMIVMYEDRVISTFAEVTNQGERIIRRSQFEDDPTLESFTEPRLPEGINPPTEIIDRPLF